MLVALAGSSTGRHTDSENDGKQRFLPRTVEIVAEAELGLPDLVNEPMPEPTIQNFHAHIYYNASDVDRAKALAEAVQERFRVAVGHFHLAPIGPHPRGSVQMTVPTEQFGKVATWLAVNRADLTIFAHASTGNDKHDHTHNVVWFGPSEELDLTIFG